MMLSDVALIYNISSPTPGSQTGNLRMINNAYMWFQKISIPPQRMVFWFGHSHPPGIFSSPSYFPLKIWAFETPLPLVISNDHPWEGRWVRIFSGTTQFAV